MSFNEFDFALYMLNLLNETLNKWSHHFGPELFWGHFFTATSNMKSNL